MSSTKQEAGTRPTSVYWALFFGLLSFSISPILVKLAAEGPGMAIATWRTLIAVAVLAPFALLRSRGEIASFSGRDLLMIGTAGVLLGFHFVSWIESLYRTSVASASILVTTSPIFLAILGYVFLKERLSTPVSVSIVLAVFGAALLGLGDVGASSTGDAPLVGNSLALSASLLFSIYLLFGRVVRRKTSWLAYVFPLYAVTALTILITALILRTPLGGYSAEFYLLCAAMALGPQVLGHGSFNFAIRYFPAAMLGLISLVEPVGASIIAYFVLGEMPTPLSLLGMIVVLAAISFAIVSRNRKKVQHAVQTD